MPDYFAKQVVIALCVYLGQILVGFGMGWSSPIIPKLQDPELTPLPAVISPNQASLVGSVLYIGTIIGPHITSYLSNAYGRKPCLFLGGMLTALALIVLATARNLAMIYTGRIMIGAGTGIIFVINLVYLGEIASTDIRGMLLTGTGIFGTLGTLIVYSTAPYVSYSVASYIGVAIVSLYITGIFVIPESPVYHVMKGNEEQARETMIFLGRTDKEEIEKVLSLKLENQPTLKYSWNDLISIRSNRKAFFINIILGILQQMSGVVVVIFFATSIFDLVGTIRPNTATIIIGVTQLVSSCISPMLVERRGRKVLLLWSCAVCGLSLMALGLYFYFDSAGFHAEKVGWLPLMCLILFFISYDMGFGIIPGALTGELFGSTARSIGSAITITVAWLFGFGLSSGFNAMLSTIGGHLTFWVFGISCMLAFLFTVFFVPETRGKSLAEIQEMLNK